MQRRKVLFPDPDGPIMHMTSRGETSRSIPRRTSSRPKLLCTASALTIGALLNSTMLAARRGRCGRRHLRRGRWDGVEGKQHAAKALEGRGGQAALGAAAEMTLQVILADREDRCHRQVPNAGDDCQFDHLEGGAGNLLRAREELGYRGHERQRGRL